MNAFDQSITLFVNQYAGRSWLFDSLIVLLASIDLLKGGLILSLFWYAWFRPCDDLPENRGRLLSMLGACLVALAITKILHLTLPYRERPLFTVDLHFTLPHGLALTNYGRQNSGPSDHATLFFALSTGLFLVSPPLGLFSFFHTIGVICFTRLYLGLHYATDLIAGALIGIVSSYLLCSGKDRTGIGRRALAWEQHSPAMFYTGLFLVTFEIATLFTGTQTIANFALKVLRVVIGYS